MVRSFSTNEALCWEAWECNKNRRYWWFPFSIYLLFNFRNTHQYQAEIHCFGEDSWLATQGWSGLQHVAFFGPTPMGWTKCKSSMMTCGQIHTYAYTHNKCTTNEHFSLPYSESPRWFPEILCAPWYILRPPGFDLAAVIETEPCL